MTPLPAGDAAEPVARAADAAHAGELPAAGRRLALPLLRPAPLPRAGPGGAAQEAIHLQVLQQTLHQELQPPHTRENPHRRETLSLRHLWQSSRL